MSHLQLGKTTQYSPASRGPLQAAARAAADARLIFSGPPRARHTPAPARTFLARPRPAGARPFTLFGSPRGLRSRERAGGGARGPSRALAHSSPGTRVGGAGRWPGPGRGSSNYSPAAGARARPGARGQNGAAGRGEAHGAVSRFRARVPPRPVPSRRVQSRPAQGRGVPRAQSRARGDCAAPAREKF